MDQLIPSIQYAEENNTVSEKSIDVVRGATLNKNKIVHLPKDLWEKFRICWSEFNFIQEVFLRHLS